LAAGILLGQHETPKAPPPPGARGRRTDAEAAELAKEALRADHPAAIKAALARLKGHTFKSSRVSEREVVLYAQGMLEARLGNLAAAAVALRKLEKQWPRSPFMGEALTVLAEDAVDQRRFKEAESRLHQALASDIPSEGKRKVQELLLFTLVEQGRPREGQAIVQSLRPLDAKEKPSERGLVAIAEVLSVAEEREQLESVRKDFQNLYPKSAMAPRVELAYGRMLGRVGDAKSAALVLRKVIQDFPSAPQANDARLALANLLTDGSLPDAKDMPTAEALLEEVRKTGKGLPKGHGQVVELRVLVSKSLWEDALNLVARMESRDAEPEVRELWTKAWNAWVAQRLEKQFPGELLARMKPGCFGALETWARAGVVELLSSNGLLEAVIPLLPEAPSSERAALRRAAIAKTQPEAQPQAMLKLLPAKGGTPDEALLRARAEAAQGRWAPLRASLLRARPGPDRIKALLRLLQRPRAATETPMQRLREADPWLAHAPEKGEAREALAILVADLRMEAGDLHGALALYPEKATSAEQRGWVALMRAQALLKLTQRDQARAVILAARDEQGFKGQRDALAKALGAY
jgi:tetratricopeptide (TPR) repeat protein